MNKFSKLYGTFKSVLSIVYEKVIRVTNRIQTWRKQADPYLSIIAAFVITFMVIFHETKLEELAMHILLTKAFHKI